MPYGAENKEGGFTLAELLVAMLISGVILAAITGTFIIQSRFYDVQEQVTEMVQTVRAAMDMTSREVRMAGYDPTDVDIVGIPYDASQLELRADLNKDGETDGTITNDDTNEEIIYSYDAANLQIDRNTGGGNQPFAENIESFGFAYLDTNGNVTTVSADIRQIQITITARTSGPDPNYSDNGGYRTYTLTSLITPRNLAY